MNDVIRDLNEVAEFLYELTVDHFMWEEDYDRSVEAYELLAGVLKQIEEEHALQTTTERETV